MTLLVIEPRDPILVRDSRPFGDQAGARAWSIDFPTPATTTGAMRSLIGRAMHMAFTEENARDLMAIAVRGPLLVEIGQDAAKNEPIIKDWFFPAPFDAVMFAGEKSDSMRRQIPVSLPAGALTNLDTDLMLVGLRDAPAGKAKPMPKFWRQAHYEEWLLGADWQHAPQDLGMPSLPRDERTHIVRDAETRTAADGKIFTTNTLEFSFVPQRQARPDSPDPEPERHTHAARGSLSTTMRLGLAIEGATPATLSTAVHPLTIGGEGRVAFARPIATPFPQCPSAIIDQIVEDHACRVILLTPAYFARGYRPTWLLESRDTEVQPQLVAVATDRPQTISGWDLQQKRAKPTRRLAPAGSVYFLELGEKTEKAAIRRWITSTWMQCISDDVKDIDAPATPGQFRLDGFGLAALGTWDGKKPVLS